MGRDHYGIDLGTTHTVLVKQTGGVCECIDLPNKPINYGEEIKYTKLMPSVVYYDRNGAAVVGEYAKNAIMFAPERVYFNAKIDLGKEPVRPEEVRHSPIDVTAEILKVCFETIYNESRKNDNTIQRINISIPAAFNNDPIEETREAVRKANTYGLDEKRIQFVEEPYAALEYMAEFDKGFRENILKKEEGTKVIVIDIGGGTTDIIACGFKYSGDDNTFKVNFKGNPGGDHRFGGAKFDHKLMKKFLTDFSNYYQVTENDVSKDSWELLAKQFIILAEDAKKYLCDSRNIGKTYELTPDLSRFDFGFTKSREPFQIKLTKKEMDETFNELLSGKSFGGRTYDCISSCIEEYLEKNQVTKNEFDYVCLTGGMSVYDKIQSAIRKKIGKKIFIAEEPLLCTAKGIAMEGEFDETNVKNFLDSAAAAADEKNQEPQKKDAEQTEEKEYQVNIPKPRQLGKSYFVDIDCQFPVEIVSKNHTYPCKMEKSKVQLKTTSQSRLCLITYEGDSIYDPKLQRLNRRIINFSDEFQEILPIGTPVDISFEIDENKLIIFYGSVDGRKPIEFFRKEGEH